MVPFYGPVCGGLPSDYDKDRVYEVRTAPGPSSLADMEKPYLVSCIINSGCTGVALPGWKTSILHLCVRVTLLAAPEAVVQASVLIYAC